MTCSALWVAWWAWQSERVFTFISLRSRMLRLVEGVLPIGFDPPCKLTHNSLLSWLIARLSLLYLPLSFELGVV